jgi:hypothetical protein
LFGAWARWPRHHRRAAEQRDELAPADHRMTAFAIALRASRA